MPFLHFVMVMSSFKFQHAPADLSHDDIRMTNRRLKEEARSGGRRGARQGRDAGENKVGHGHVVTRSGNSTETPKPSCYTRIW